MGIQITFYNLCFFVYVWLVPVFLQYLMRAPSTFDSAPFYPVSVRTLNGDVPSLQMSSFPQTTAAGVNHCRPCKEDKHDKKGMYQWDIMLEMSSKDLITTNVNKPVSTMYPVIFASMDGKSWRVVADADDVAGKDNINVNAKTMKEPTHISASLLVANLKNFGCIDEEESTETDPFMTHFSTKEKANTYKWKLVEHMSMHGSVNLVACVTQGMEDVNQIVDNYARHCIVPGGFGEMKCHLSPRQALSKCFALGSACGQSCRYFAPTSPNCKDGRLDPVLFEGLTQRRVKIKTSPGGGGAAEALVSCTKKHCQRGLHYSKMYVEAENPIDFMRAQMDVKNNEKGSFYVLIFAMSDFHPPMHVFSVKVKKAKDKHKTHLTHSTHLTHKLSHSHVEKEKEKEEAKKEEGKKEKKKETEEKKEKKDKDEKEKDEKKKDEKDEKKDKKEEEKDEEEEEEEEESKRICVDLPGVRLDEIDHTTIVGTVAGKDSSTPKECTAQCGQRPECKQSIFAQANKGCYLFKIATVQVKDFSDAFNSSYCGNEDDEETMLTMIHAAYKGFVPKTTTEAPSPAMAGPPPPQGPAAGIRVLTEAKQKAFGRRLEREKQFFWQIAHVPNLTMGVLKDQGASSMRVIPRNGSCFSSPGFVYMVACMTAKPVYMSGRNVKLEPPPFNDRCLAVGGLCGASCGSGAEQADDVAKLCPLSPDGASRRLQEASPYASAEMFKEKLVQPIHPRRSSTSSSLGARIFFHLFVFFIAISYMATLLGKFPGNFTDYYPEHTWDEICRHGYVMKYFGSAASCGCSASESKMVVMRNWIGKISARPEFTDAAFPTFSKWVDVFCDEGHREGARILWQAWTDFLDTNPPLEFLEEWSKNILNVSWDQAATRSPFDLAWNDGKGRKVLPVIREQADKFMKEAGEEILDGGVELQQDTLMKLKDLFEVYKVLPENLKLQPALPVRDDCVLVRKVRLGLQSDGDQKSGKCFTITNFKGWQHGLESKVNERVNDLNLSSKEDYKNSLRVTDNLGKAVAAFGQGSSSITEKQFPLLFREPLPRSDRQVVMIYAARAKPETDRPDIEKTRELDTFLWANLRPQALLHGKKDGEPRRSFKKKPKAERTPLMANNAEAESLAPEEVRRCVLGTVQRQNEHFLEGLSDKEAASPTRRNSVAAIHKEYAKSYLRFRTVESDWEMARFCYGEIMGEDVDINGDEVLILDNPSPALLELVSELPGGEEGARKAGMGLVSQQAVEEKQCMGGTKMVNRTTYAKPSVEFRFGGSGNTPKEFQPQLRKKLQEWCACSSQEVAALSIKENSEDGQLTVKVTGPGKLIELIRERNPTDVQVCNFHGRLKNSHPKVLVKKSLLMPYSGVRGKSGGLNFAVDLLQFRDGYIGTGEENDPTPEHMLFGIFDARHQPHVDFWRKCLPKFMNTSDVGYNYEVNDQVCMVQAPQHFAAVNADDDILDVMNGMCFNIMNVIRNRCGGVTSCGTNAVWHINAREFSRQNEDSVTAEYFDSRTKIEDTASTHMNFCNGKRSVYVQEKISTGIAKLNADYLCAMQRWAEGAVQLFWLQIFSDHTRPLVLFAVGAMTYLGAIYFSLYGPWAKEMLGFNLFCDVEGEMTLFLGADHAFCMSLYDLFSWFLGHTIDKVIFKMAVHDYMRLVDFAISWFFVCLAMAGVTILLSMRGTMPKIVRTFIMMENISYWLTSCSIFFWLSLTLFMILFQDPPLMFNVTHFMLFILAINIIQHSMLNEYKALGDCDEISIWRSQQSYTLAAPLYVMAIVRGTASAWGIIWRRLDKSFWTSSDHGSDVITGVTVWVTFIWVAFITSICVAIGMALRSWLMNEIGHHIQMQCQLGALCMLALLAITVWEPFLTLWGIDKSINAISRGGTKEGDDKGSFWVRQVSHLIVWWRGRAWIMRYIIDFGMPLVILSGLLGGGINLITLCTYASTVHGFRG